MLSEWCGVLASVLMKVNCMSTDTPTTATKRDESWWRVLTKCDPLEKRMANHFSILALRTPMNSMKRQKDGTLKDELPKLVGALATEDQLRNNSRKNEEMEPK